MTVHVNLVAVIVRIHKIYFLSTSAMTVDHDLCTANTELVFSSLAA